MFDIPFIDMFEFHLINIITMLSIVITGLTMGVLFRKLVDSRIIYFVVLFNIVFMLLLLTGHIVTLGEDPDDTYLWVEAVILNLLFMGSLCLGQKLSKGVIDK